MRIVDRLATYLTLKKITAYAFERSIDVANGYLKKQLKGKGSVGSEILNRIYHYYTDLDFIWLLTGDGEMLRPEPELPVPHFSKDEMIEQLNERISVLQSSLEDKQKIIELLKDRDGNNSGTVSEIFD
jgi:transcriptional regulator with XRE-family HTH domain